MTEHSRNTRAAETIADLRALMAELRVNVEQLTSILTTTPEVPSGDTAPA